jgi:hypothetical protein
MLTRWMSVVAADTGATGDEIMTKRVVCPGMEQP